MAKAQKQVKKRKKGARKKFFEAKVPLTATKVHLYSYSPEELDGTVVKIDLTRSLRGKNIELRAKIKADGEDLIGEPISLRLMQFYIKKVMRRGTDKVEDSFIVDCKDAKLRVKTFMVTRKRVSRAIKNNIRKTAKKYLESKITIKTSHELFSDTMAGKIQKELSTKVKKVYPLALCEIRVLEILQKVELKAKKTKETTKDAEDSKKE